METKNKELDILYHLLSEGHITTEEFLTFAELSFASELLKMIQDRKAKDQPG